jgi:hypothetical protein
MDRREAIKWMLAATATLSVIERSAFGAATPAATGYGSDPNLMEVYKPGDLWPLTLTAAQRQTVVALCDLIIPADDKSPSASQVMVPDFIDEWISAPYPNQQADRKNILDGLAWLDMEADARFHQPFAGLSLENQRAIADDICSRSRAAEKFKAAAEFFARFRDLTASGFYTSAEGMKDLQYIGNVALPKYVGPPPEVLAYLKLK